MKLGSLRPDHAKRLCYIQRGCSQTGATIGAAPLSQHLQSSSPRRISRGTPGIPWGRDAKLPVRRRGGKFEPQGPRVPGARPALLSVFWHPLRLQHLRERHGGKRAANAPQLRPRPRAEPPSRGFRHSHGESLLRDGPPHCSSSWRRLRIPISEVQNHPCSTGAPAHGYAAPKATLPAPAPPCCCSSSTKHQHQGFRSSLRVFSPDKDKPLSAF